MTDDRKEQAKLEVVIGDISISYEGSQSFIEVGLQDLISNIIDLAPHQIAAAPESSPAPSSTNLQHMSTNTIASNSSAKSGTDLVMSAIAHIQLVAGKDRAVRGEILSEMKNATTYYKSTYGSNLSSYLDSLVKNRRINLIAENTYSLTAHERSSMEKILAAN